MGLGIDAIKNFMTQPVNERQAGGAGRVGGKNFFVNPGTGVSGIPSEYGISIPKNHSYTEDVDGTKVAMGQDGVGLAHRNAAEYGLHLIA